MTRFISSAVFVMSLVLAVPAGAAPAPADKTALAQIPASAPAVFYVHGFEGSAERLLVYLKNALPANLSGLAEGAIKKALEDGIDGRKFSGLVKDGPIFAALSEMPKSGEEPKFAVVFAVTDYKAFRDGLLKDDERKGLKVSPKGYESAIMDGKTAYFVERKGYAVLTPDENTAIAYTKKQPGLDTKISKEQSARFLAGDFGIYLSMDVVNKDYAEQIKEAKTAIEEALKAAEDGVGKNQKSAMAAVRNLVGPIFQAVEDSKGVLLTIEFRPTALVVHAQSELRPNTKTSDLLKTFKPFTVADLDVLPPGQVFYTGLMTNAEMLKLLGPLTVGAVAEPGTKSAKTMDAALKELALAGPGARRDVAGLPATGIQTWQFVEPAKAFAAERQILESLGAGDTFAGGMLKHKTTLKKSAVKYKKLEFDALTLEWDFEKMAAGAAGGMELPAEIQKKLAAGFKKILGEKTTIWISADDKQLLNVTAADWKAATTLLDTYFSGDDVIGKKKGYLEARKELPAGGTMVGLVDVVRYGTAIAEIAVPIVAGFGVNLPDKFPAKLPKDDPSFFGGAATLDEKRIGFDLVITSSAVRDMYKAFVAPFLGGF